MRDYPCLTVVGACLAAASCGHETGEPPPAVAAVFAPETISPAGSNIYRGSFSPDGVSFYFFRKVAEGQEDYRIFQSQVVDGAWQQPVQLSLGGDYSDLYPTVSPDGSVMVFTSYRPAPGDTANHGNANLWYSRKEGERWGAPRFLADASTLANYDAGPWFDAEGILHYNSTTPDWSTTVQRRTAWTGASFGPVESDPLLDPWRSWREDAHVWSATPAPSGDVMILDISPVDGRGRRGPTDLWFVRRNGTGWTEPEPLAAGVNTGSAYENFVTFSPDGATMYFVRGFERYYHVALATAVGQ